MKWIGQHIYDLVSKFRNDVTIDGRLQLNNTLNVNKSSIITNPSDSGATALTISNADIDQKALDIDAENTTTTVLNIQAQPLTTANAIYVNCDSLTTGKALRLDVDDALTTSATKTLLDVDYDKAGVTGSGQTSNTTGISVNMADAATNHGSGSVVMIGAQIDVDSANAQGSIRQQGLILNVGRDSVGDAATTTGVEMTVIDGANDIVMKSSADNENLCSIATTTNGATTITTHDESSTAAHFEIAADGDITLDSAGQIKLEPVAGNNILLDGTVTVDGGSVTGITTLGVDSVSLTAIQTSSESYVDNDTSLMTSAAIDDHTNKKAIRTYGNTIKLLFTDFVGNEDGGATKAAPIFDDDGGNIGIKPGSSSTMLYAVTDIPEGKKATHVTVYGNNTKAVDVYELNVNASSGSALPASKGTGSVGTELNFTDVNSTATNYLVVRVSTSATSDRIYGAIITTADI